MALYDALDRHDRVEAVAYTPSRPVATEAPAFSKDDVIGAVRAVLLALLLPFWVAGAYAGIVYWSLQGSLLGVLASAVIPSMAATSTWWAFRPGQVIRPATLTVQPRGTRAERVLGHQSDNIYLAGFAPVD